MLPLLALAAVADAQAALTETSIVGPGGLCVAVAPYANDPPPPGTRLVLAVCDGSDAQRFTMCLGDCQGELGFHRMDIVEDHGRPVLRPHHDIPTAALGESVVEFWVELQNGGGARLSHCLTATMPPRAGALLTVDRCDGRAAQQFSGR